MMELKFLQIALKVNKIENYSFLCYQQRQNIILRDDLSKNVSFSLLTYFSLTTVITQLTQIQNI